MPSTAQLRREFVYAEDEKRYQGVAIGALDKADEAIALARQTIPWLHQRLTLLHAQNRPSDAEDLHYLIVQLEKLE